MFGVYTYECLFRCVDAIKNNKKKYKHLFYFLI